LESYALNGIEAEWFPPRWAHTDDKSGFDIAACLASDAERVLVSIEVKYTDSFSRAPIVWSRYAQHLENLGLNEKSTAALVETGCSQVLRQALITDSVRRVGLVGQLLATPDTAMPPRSRLPHAALRRGVAQSTCLRRRCP
jgi:hypothetical protein